MLNYDINGQSSTRYFGEEYRKVKYDVVSINNELKTIVEEFNITYPDKWSVKNGQIMNSHLSTGAMLYSVP